MRNSIDIAFGFASGFKSFQEFGISSVISAAGDYVIGPEMTTAVTSADANANRLHLLDSPGTLTITRASGSDTGRVSVTYLDSDWYERVTVYALDAASKTVDVTGATITARRVNAMDYLPGGNVGNIDAKLGNDLICRIGAGHGLSRVANYCTPKGQRVALTGFGIASQATRPIQITLWYREPGKLPKVLNAWPSRETLEVFSLPIPRLIQSANRDDWPTVAPIREGIDIFATARRPIGSMDTADVAAYIGFLAQINSGDPDAPGFSVF